MASLLDTMLLAQDQGLEGEYERAFGGLSTERRALLRLRLRGFDPAHERQALARELIRLTRVEIMVEDARVRACLAEYTGSNGGRRPHSFARNLILAAASEEWGCNAVTANRLGDVTYDMLRRAHPRAAKIATDFLSMIGAAGEDAEAFLRRRILETRAALVETDGAMRRQRSDAANSRAHPTARQFYARPPSAIAAARPAQQ